MFFHIMKEPGDDKTVSPVVASPGKNFKAFRLRKPVENHINNGAPRVSHEKLSGDPVFIDSGTVYPHHFRGGNNLHSLLPLVDLDALFAHMV